MDAPTVESEGECNRRATPATPADRSGLELSSAVDALVEREPLVLTHRGSSHGVRSDQRWVRNFLALGLQPATGILQTTSDSGIDLG